MPKSKFAISLNLLKPQSNPEKLPVRLMRWLLSTGRFIFVFVEALVLIAFIARFKLDADLAAKKEAIEEQIPYIESLKSYEILIRQTQLKLSTIGNIKRNAPEWSAVLQKIAVSVPDGMKIAGINLEKNIGNASVHITGQAQTSNDLTRFITGLKEDSAFSEVNLVSIGLEKEAIKFAVDASVKLTSSEEKIYEE